MILAFLREGSGSFMVQKKQEGLLHTDSVFLVVFFWNCDFMILFERVRGLNRFLGVYNWHHKKKNLVW